MGRASCTQRRAKPPPEAGVRITAVSMLWIALIGPINRPIFNRLLTLVKPYFHTPHLRCLQLLPEDSRETTNHQRSTRVLAHVFSPQYEAIGVARRADPQASYAACDELVLEVSRDVLGAALLRARELPVEVGGAVRKPSMSQTKSRYAMLLRFTRQLLALEGLSSYPLPDAVLAVPDTLRLEPTDVGTVRQRLIETVDDISVLASVFG